MALASLDLPGLDRVYLDNIEVASDGRTVCGGVSRLTSAHSIEVHAADGTLQKTFTFRASSFSDELKNPQRVVTPDGFVAVALTGASSLVFVPIGP
jgi:hypothetical protein